MIKAAARRALIVVTGAWLPVLLILWWWSASAESTDPYFPPLSLIWEQFKVLWVFDLVPIHVVPTLQNLFTGLAIGVLVGIIGGAYLGISRRTARYIEPVIDFFRSIPPVATVPVFILIFGFDASMRIAAISLSVMFPVLLATMQGVRSTDTSLLDTAAVFKLSKFQTLWRVRVPAASPTIFAGLQLSLQVGFVVAIASELLGSGFGLGAFTLIATESFMILDAWTGVLLLGLLGYALNLAFDLIERRTLRWYFAHKKIA